MEWGTVVTAVLGVFGTVLTGFGTVLGVLWRDVKTATEAHLACEVKHAKLEGTVEGLKREIDTLRVLSKDENTQSMWVVCDLTGNILDVGGRVTSLLRYRATELIGKNINVFIPENLRSAHDDGLSKIARGGPIRAAAVTGEALRSDGSTVKVVISLSPVNYVNDRAIKAELFELMQ